MSDSMQITRYTLFLDRFELEVAIGVHDFERRGRQSLAISIELDIDPQLVPAHDDIAAAPDYDWVRLAITGLVAGRRYELQETLARAIIDLAAARAEVMRVAVETAKLDVYPDVRAVGCRLEAHRRPQQKQD